MVPNSSPEHRVARAVAREPVADHLLDRAVGLGDRREVGLGLDHQVAGSEPRHRERVGGVGERVREREVGREVGREIGQRCRECSPVGHSARETGAMARRWVLTGIVAVALVVAAVFAAHAIRDDDTAAPAPTTTTTGPTTSTTAAPTSTTGAPTTTVAVAGPTTDTATTTAPAADAPPGPCGADTGPVRAAVDAGVADAQADADVASCRLAPSDPTWAAVQLAAKPGATVRAAHGDPPRRRGRVDRRRQRRDRRRMRVRPPNRWSSTSASSAPVPVAVRDASTTGGGVGRRPGRGRVEPGADGGRRLEVGRPLRARGDRRRAVRAQARRSPRRLDHAPDRRRRVHPGTGLGVRRARPAARLHRPRHRRRRPRGGAPARC